MRKDSDARSRYSRLKQDLAAQFPDSFDDYIEGKTALIGELLEQEGLGGADLGSIREANKASKIS